MLPACSSTPNSFAISGQNTAIRTNITTTARQVIAILSARSRAIAIWVGDRPATVFLTGTAASSWMSLVDSSVGWIPMVTFLVEAGFGVTAVAG